ncbi:titin [Drosophila obscura]|uniref:titin n=1 Tax=Drosophila obscura TaxID=7282 RepID=UPI001BB2B611|nr:titin [Drosophila obscura]
MVGKLKVCIIGSESWGSAIAASVSNNVQQMEGFDSRAHIYVYDELVRSKYLSEVMNNCHENIKYLPGIRLPENLIAVNDLLEAAQNADIIIFATPQHFVRSYCNILAGKVKKNAIALSMVKGLAHVSDGEIDLYSSAISKHLDIPCYSMMTANSAMEMAQGKLCEMTIGCNNDDDAQLLTELLQTENCRVIAIDDVDGVELCGTLKDIIALGAGFVDGLKLGENARVAALHLGVKEMMRFTMAFYPTAKMSTFFESCAVANSVASTYVDKNVTFAKSFITSGKTIQEIESNLLNGRKLLGPLVAAELNAFLEEQDMQDEFPLFTAIHQICQNEVDPETILDTLRTHPDLSSSLSFSQFLSQVITMDDSLEKVLEQRPEPIAALEKALAETVKKKSFRELQENGSWNSVYNANQGKRQPPTDPWQVNEQKGLQISCWLESSDSTRPTVASGTQGSGENDNIVGSTTGSDEGQGSIGFTEHSDAEKLTEKTKKELPVDKTWLRDQPPPMITGSDDKGNKGTKGESPPPFQDTKTKKVKAVDESVEMRPRPYINTFQALNIKPMTGKQNEAAITASSKANQNGDEVFPKKLVKPSLAYTKEIRQQIEAFTSKGREDSTPESKKNDNASEEPGKQNKTDVDKASKAETSNVKENTQQQNPKSPTENANLKQAETLEHEQTKPGEATISRTPEDHENQKREEPVKDQDENSHELKVASEQEPEAGPEHKFVFNSLEDKERFESILLTKSKKDRLSRIDDTETGQQYTQTWRYMSPPKPLQNLQICAEDNPHEQTEDVEVSESMEDNKAAAREQKDRDSLTEENFEKWKQVEAEERPPKHAQTEENMYLSAEELIRRELQHHHEQKLELAEQMEGTSILLKNEGEGKQELVPGDEEVADSIKVLAEERENDGQRPAKRGQKKPHQSPDEANLRFFSFDKKDGKGHTTTPTPTTGKGEHEWDWLHNKETPETESKPVDGDERLSEYYVNKKSDQQKLEMLNERLQDIFQQHMEEAPRGPEASGNSVESHESVEAKPLALDPVTGQKKRDTQQPQTPMPAPKQTPAKAPPPMPKRQKIAEGSPQFQVTPRTIPPPSPQTLPLTPQELQPHRKDLPIQFNADTEPPAPQQTDESLKAARGQKGAVDIPPATIDVSKPPSPGDQQAIKQAEAPTIDVKKFMPHFLTRGKKPKPTKKVEPPTIKVERYKPLPILKKSTPKSHQNQREHAYELVNDPRVATQEPKPAPEDNTPPSTAKTEKPAAQEHPKERQEQKQMNYYEWLDDPRAATQDKTTPSTAKTEKPAAQEHPKERQEQKQMHSYEWVDYPRAARGDNTTAKTEKPAGSQETPKEQEQMKADEVTKKLRNKLRNDQEKKVGYKGKNPFLKEPDLQSNPPMDTSLEHDLARRRSNRHQSRRKVVVKPPFNPPLNPRVRIPRPPFDGREREYHTQVMPASCCIAPCLNWPVAIRKPEQATLRAGNQLKHLAIVLHQPRQMKFISRPAQQLPLGLLPRCPALNKLLCAVQLGLLARLLARFRNGHK